MKRPPIKSHGYTKCPACAYRVKPEDVRCFYCDLNFYPGALPSEIRALQKKSAPAERGEQVAPRAAITIADFLLRGICARST